MLILQAFFFLFYFVGVLEHESGYPARAFDVTILLFNPHGESETQNLILNEHHLFEKMNS